jgi:hypothetical protein
LPFSLFTLCRIQSRAKQNRKLLQRTENKEQRPKLIASFGQAFYDYGSFQRATAGQLGFRQPGAADENKRRTPILTGRRSHVSRAHFSTFRAQNSCASRETPRPRAQVLRRVIHTIDSAPVDITVDKGTSLNDEKAQQNQHFKYHRVVLSLYNNVNKALIATAGPNCPASSRSAAIVTLLWNMHRSGAACSLNVTSIGIWLSRKQYVVTAIAQFSPRNARRR